MSSVPYLSCTNISFSYGNDNLFTGLSLSIHPGDRLGIIGVNGTGKSTLLEIINQQKQPDIGSVSIRKDIKVSYITQDFEVSNLTVIEYLEQNLAIEFDLDKQITEIEQKIIEHTNNHLHDKEWEQEWDILQNKLLELSGAGTKNLLQSALKIGRLESIAERKLGTLSGGEKKRTQIIGTFLQNPHLILLDEPTNHLDIDTIEWLEEFLLEIAESGISLLGIKPKNYVPEAIAFVLVSHDRALLDTVIDKILEIHLGEWKIFYGNYEKYLEQKLLLDVELKKMQEKTANLYRREIAWLKSGVKARTTKQVARINRALSLGKNFKDLNQKVTGQKMVEIKFEANIDELDKNTDNIIISKQKSLGNQQLIYAENLSIKHPVYDFMICEKLDLYLKPKIRVALLGPNGSGKTTLMNVLLSKSKDYLGTIKYHDACHISSFEQHRQSLDLSLTTKQTLCPKGEFVFFDGKYLHINAYLDKFNFDKLASDKIIKLLSGGEQARLLLAKIMLEYNNVLSLDEPTNDLDILSLQILEKSLLLYEGAIVFTSHDRYFLKRVATHILVCLEQKQNGQQSSNKWIMVSDLDQALELLEKNAETNMIKNDDKAQVLKEKGKKKKLSYNEEKELNSIENKIPIFENKISVLNKELEHLYINNNDYKEIQNKQNEQKQIEEELNNLYIKWEELMSKRE